MSELLQFTKMQGCGNDYVYLDCTKGMPSYDATELAIRVSDRHFGIGSDGLIMICSSDVADFRMQMHNADGSQSEMCGNGIRCVGKYVYDKGLTDKTKVSVETLAGIKYLDLHIEDGVVKSVTVDMGAPILDPKLIPVISDREQVIDEPIDVDGTTYSMTCVSMGNPHAVVFVDSTADFPLETIGPKFENHPVFPRRTNTEFIQVIDRDTINMRVFERGTGETLACGTGTCASVMACILNGKTNDKVKVHLLGGDIIVEYDRKSGHLFMTGPAQISFEGSIIV